MKKLLAAFCAAALAVGAVTSVSANQTEYLTVPQSVLPQNASEIKILIFKSESGIETTEDAELVIKNIGVDGQGKELLLVDEKDAAEEIKYKVGEQAKSGAYPVYLSYSCNGVRTEKLVFAAFYRSDERVDILRELENCDETELYNLLFRDRYLYDIDFTAEGSYMRYADEKAKNNIIHKMSLENFGSAEEVKRKMLSYLAVYSVNGRETDDPSFIADMDELLSPIIDYMDDEILVELQNEAVKRKTYELLAESDNGGTIDGLRKAISDKTALALFASGDIRRFRTAAEKYNSIYGFDLGADYQALDAYKDQAFMKLAYLQSGIDSKKTISSLADAFKTAVAEVKKSISGNTVSPPSGGGSGRYSGGGGAQGFPSNKETVKQPETEESNYVFEDVPRSHWGYTAIKELKERGITDGVGNNMFAPEREISRAELVKLLAEFFEIEPVSGTACFEDVSDSHWAAGYIAAAAEKGLIKGVDDKRFGIDNTLTREDAAVMCVRFMQYKRISSIYSEPHFADAGEIADYAAEAVGIMVNEGIMNGTGENVFAPKDTLTRAMGAQILYNIIIRKGGR